MKNFISDLMDNQTKVITLCGLKFEIRYSVFVINEIVKNCAIIDYEKGYITKNELNTKNHAHKTYLNHINNTFSPTSSQELKTDSFIFFIHQGINLNANNKKMFTENGMENGIEMEVLLELFRKAKTKEITEAYESFIELFGNSLNMNINEAKKAEEEKLFLEENKKKLK